MLSAVKELEEKRVRYELAYNTYIFNNDKIFNSYASELRGMANAIRYLLGKEALPDTAVKIT